MERHLPVETWLEVLSFVPYSSLHATIPYVCRKFAVWALPIADELHPRIIKSIWISYDKETNSRKISIKCSANSLKLTHYSHFSQQYFVQNELDEFPTWPPPARFRSIERIRVEGKLDGEVLVFLEMCRERMGTCKLDFENVGQFLGQLDKEQIPLEQFLTSINSCESIWLDGRAGVLPAHFFASPCVLQCQKLVLFRPTRGYDPTSLSRWLKTGVQKAKQLEILNEMVQHSLAEELVDSLIAERESEAQQEQPGSASPSFVLDLFNVNLLRKPRNSKGMELRRLNGQCWQLRRRGTAEEAADNDEALRQCTRIDLGTFP